MKESTRAFVFARGGSKGVPGKNLRVVGGKTLLHRSVEMALQVVGPGRVYVSTDDDVISRVALSAGARVIRRGPELSGDNSPEWFAWQHAIRHVREAGDDFTTFLSVPPTAPLRAVEDVENCLAACGVDVDCVVTMTPSSHSPFFNMVTPDGDGAVTLAARALGDIRRRQDAPAIYSLTTVAYAAKTDFVMTHSGMWEGRVVGVEVPQERALDIDTLWDLRVANLVLSEGIANDA